MATIQCTCGRTIEVGESLAGSTIHCSCGQQLAVPDPLPTDAGQVESAATDDELMSERRFLVFLTSPQELPNRISFDAASHFVTACDRVLQRYFDQHPWQLDLQVAMALLPNGKTLVEVQTQPPILPDQAAGELADELESMARPPVQNGPVAFAIRRPIGGGAAAASEFQIPFHSFIQTPGELDQILLAAGGITSARPPAAPGWFQRLWQRLCQLLRPATRELPAREGTSEEPSDAQQQIAAAIQSGDLAELRQCRQRHGPSPELLDALAATLVGHEQYEEAIDAYNELLSLDPHDAAALSGRGRAHCLNGSLQRGLADYDLALQQDPQDAETRASRAMLYVELEAWQAAEADLTRAIELVGIQPQLFIERARARYYLQQVEAAQQDLKQALQLDPYCVEAYMLSGWILQHLPQATTQDIAAAAALFSQAIQIEPDNPVYLLQRAEAYAGQGKYALTIADCDQVLSLDEHHAVAYGIRGYAHQQLDHLPEAVADCTRAIELGLESAAVYFSRAVGYAAEGKVDQALSDCDEAIHLAPDYAAAYNYRGMLRLGQGEIEAATADFVEASRLAPAWSTPREFRADAHRLQSQYEQAIEQYTETIRLEPENLSAYIGRALAHLERRDFDQAWQDLTRALEIDSDCAPAYFHRAELSTQREQYEQALADLDHALALDADFAPAYHARAQVYLQLRRNEEAVADYSRLIELHPEWPGGYVGRANAWVNLGDQHKASEDYDEAAQLDPDSSQELQLHRLIVEAHHLHESEEYARAIAKAGEALEMDDRSIAALAARAASHWYSEQFVEALDDYSRLLAIQADAPFALVGRGQVYAELGEYELALADLNRAVELEQSNAADTGLAYALNGRALAFAGLQRFTEAEQDFAASIRLRPRNAFLHYNQGLVYRLRGSLDQAAAAFRQALQLDEPRLTQRKRHRAEAFLRHYEGAAED